MLSSHFYPFLPGLSLGATGEPRVGIAWDAAPQAWGEGGKLLTGFDTEIFLCTALEEQEKRGGRSRGGTAAIYHYKLGSDA